VQPLGILKPRTAGDWLVWQLSPTEIGTFPTYPNIYKRNGLYAIVNQTDNIDAGIITNASYSFEGNWSATETKITTRDSLEAFHYVMGVLNPEKAIKNRIVFTVTARSRKDEHFNKYLLKVDLKPSSFTLYNFDESFSKTSRLTTSEQRRYFKYYSTPGKQGYTPVASLDNEGNFYDISGDGDGGYVFIYWLNSQPSAVSKKIRLPGSVRLLDGMAVEEGKQQGACVSILAKSTKEVYAFFRQRSGSFYKVFKYKTTDLGETWQDQGDVFPDIDDNIYAIIFPSNILDIPADRNFIILGKSGPAPVWSAFYFKKAAWGTIQPENGGNPYDTVTAYLPSEYDRLMVRSFYIEKETITNNGVALHSLIDQSPSKKNVIATGSPELNDDQAPQYVSFDKKDDAISLPFTDLDTLSEGTIFAVVRVPSGSEGGNFFLSASRNDVNNHYRLWGWSEDNKIKHMNKFGGGLTSISGKTTLEPSKFYILAFVHQNTGCGVMKWVNGKLQMDDYQSRNDKEGRFFNHFNGDMTCLEIGRLVRKKGTNFYGFELKHLAISPTPMNWTQLSKSFKYLANKYRIPLDTFYQ
jgi:hypothetical protein